MTSAIIGLAGATLGALMALVGSAINERQQVRGEHTRWHRDRRSAAYDSLFRSLTRAASYRYKIPMTGVSDQPVMQQWFDDLVEVQYRLRVLISHCHRPGGGTFLPVAVERLNTALALLAEGKLTKSVDLIDEVVDLVTSSARLALAGRVPLPSSRSRAASEPRQDVGGGS